MFTTKIYDIGNSVIMGFDVLGTALELKKENPVTMGGQALKRYRKYIESFVPESFAPSLHPDLHLKRYFQAEGLEVAAINIYAGWIATFFSWLLLPIIQPINLYHVVKSHLVAAKTAREAKSQASLGRHGAPSYGE